MKLFLASANIPCTVCVMSDVRAVHIIIKVALVLQTTGCLHLDPFKLGIKSGVIREIGTSAKEKPHFNDVVKIIDTKVKVVALSQRTACEGVNLAWDSIMYQISFEVTHKAAVKLWRQHIDRKMHFILFKTAVGIAIRIAEDQGLRA